MPTRSQMLIPAPVSKHWIHSRRKLKNTTARNVATRMQMKPRISHQALQFSNGLGRCASSTRDILDTSIYRKGRESRVTSLGLRAQVSVFQVGQFRFRGRSDDHLARADVNAAHPLPRLDHEPFG